MPATDPLDGVRTILLVDWPGPEGPATLIRAGYEVYGHEPDGLRQHHVDDSAGRFALEGGAWLADRMVDDVPAPDLVCTYRPVEEQPEIVADAIKRGARVFWVEPGEGTSPEARAAAEAAGLTFVDGVSLFETVSARSG
jgi:predicted CoA-binding protein